MTLLKGNCLETLKTLPDNSVDSIVTDPPYELGFMGKSWDNSGIAYNQDLWAECLRVLKPGGHLLAFSGSRTYHRMVVAIEDSGFEIRDQIMYLYGSGFPKSLDVSKAIDKTNGETDRLIRFTLWMRTTGLKVKDVTQVLVENNLISENGTIAGHYFAMKSTSQPAIPTVAMWKVMRPLIAEVPEWVDELVQRIEAEREVVGTKDSNLLAVAPGLDNDRSATTLDITAPATPAAKQWQGWGTALKPAHEPIVVARKPLIGTVANNVLTYGTGAINIDGSRVGTDERINQPAGSLGNDCTMSGGLAQENAKPTTATGRWPANVIHDGSEEVLAGFPNTGKSGVAVRRNGNNAKGMFPVAIAEGSADVGFNDSGSAARFFYCAKASKSERNAGLEGLPERIVNEITPPGTQGANSPRAGAGRNGATQNFHPTVKPLALMRYLVKLVTPPNGTVLDPFLGSGTTAVAVILEGFNWIGCEMTEDYWPIIEARVAWAQKEKECKLL
jgi:DNA modification methylase